MVWQWAFQQIVLALPQAWLSSQWSSRKNSTHRAMMPPAIIAWVIIFFLIWVFLNLCQLSTSCPLISEVPLRQRTFLIIVCRHFLQHRIWIYNKEQLLCVNIEFQCRSMRCLIAFMVVWNTSWAKSYRTKASEPTRGLNILRQSNSSTAHSNRACYAARKDLDGRCILWGFWIQLHVLGQLVARPAQSCCRF